MSKKQAAEIENYAGRSLWEDAWYRFKKNKLAVLGLIFVLLLIVIAFATIIIDIATHGSVYQALAVKQNLRMKLHGPSLQHIFGCDEFGRDIFFRLIWGTRYSLFIGIISIIFALVVGGLLGAVAGFYGGKVDNIIMRVMDIFLSIPSMVMAIAIVSALGTSTFNLLLSIAVPQMPRLARIVRAQVMTVKGKDFIEASRAVGAGDMQIIVQASLSIGSAILSIAGLSFLGIGVQPPTPEWGSILSSARTYMRDAWHISVIPGLMIMLTVLSLNLAGDGLRDALDPKMKN
ncbi:MAG: ABC transporter permease [Lachnospiraceae bacterium]|nr:MAG: ABC transporter permease [Lachnospiraceae bacterium]